MAGSRKKKTHKRKKHKPSLSPPKKKKEGDGFFHIFHKNSSKNKHKNAKKYNEKKPGKKSRISVKPHTVKKSKAPASPVKHKNAKLSSTYEEIRKFKTGIAGFDKLLSTGIPEGSAVLVEGGPGSGKTIFCLNVCHNMCQRDLKVLYMSFEEPERRLISHMEGFGWEPVKYIKNEKLVIRRFSALDIARSVEALLSEAKKELLIDVKPMFFPKGFNPDIVFVDSLTSIASAFSGEQSRFRIYMEQLFKYLEKENITSFLIRETQTPSHIGQATGKEEAVSFLADGIIAVYNVLQKQGTRGGAIEMVKMRGEKFDKKIVEMEIISKKGMVVYPERIVSLDHVLT